MNKGILFVQENNSFLINTIISSLEKEFFDCMTVSFKLDDISRVIEAYPCVFINVEADTYFKHKSELIFLKDQGSFNDRKFMIMGMENDIQNCMPFLDQNSMLDAFERPINTREVVDRIVNTFNNVVDTSSKKHILVVDDSGTFLHTIKSWLEPTYKIIMVNSATSAIAFLAGNKPDLILLDYEMPICSGPKLLEMIRSDKENQDIPVIFLTGKGDRESVRKVLALRPQGYLLKNMPREKILETLANFFADR